MTAPRESNCVDGAVEARASADSSVQNGRRDAAIRGVSVYDGAPLDELNDATEYASADGGTMKGRRDDRSFRATDMYDKPEQHGAQGATYALHSKFVG